MFVAYATQSMVFAIAAELRQVSSCSHIYLITIPCWHVTSYTSHFMHLELIYDIDISVNMPVICFSYYTIDNMF